MLILRTDFTIDEAIPRTRLIAFRPDGGAVTGFVDLQHVGLRAAKFVGLFVVKEYRRRAVATNLVEMCERISRGSGCKVLACCVNVKNEEAQALYVKLGFGYAWEFTDDDERLLSKVL